MPGRYDLNLYRGDSYNWKFSIWSNAGRTVPTNLTGCTVAAEIRDRPAGSVIVPLFTHIATVPPLTVPNQIAVILAAGNWDVVDAGEWDTELAAWDLEITFPDDRVMTVVHGNVKVTPDITNSDTLP